MRAVIQRVAHASVEVDGRTTGSIERGLLVLLGAGQEDTDKDLDYVLEKTLNLRIFPDEQGKMNLSLRDIEGGLLLVPQFTLAANTKKGRRPSFTSAASPDHGRAMFDSMVEHARKLHSPVESGSFGADMQVSSCNDGPVTFWLQA